MLSIFPSVLQVVRARAMALPKPGTLCVPIANLPDSTEHAPDPSQWILTKMSSV